MRGYEPPVATRSEAIHQALDLGNFDEEAVKQIIQGELDAALGQDGGQLSRDRLQALQYYQGDKLGTEVPGRSTVVMRSVLEAVEWVLPALLRIFTASDRIAVVEPQLPEQEEMAESATLYLNHIFYKDNDGFMVLHDWIKDALLEKLGWIKVWFSTVEENVTKSYTHISEADFAALQEQDGDVTVVKKRIYSERASEIGQPVASRPMAGPMPGPVQGLGPAPAPQPPAGVGMPGGLLGMLDGGMPGMTPGGAAPSPQLLAALVATAVPPAVKFVDCTIRVSKPKERVVIENCPPEEILFSRYAKRGNVPFLAHRTRRTFSDLVLDGYDAETLDQVPMDDSPEQNSERVERRDDMAFPPYDRTDTERTVWVEENYLYLSPDDDPKNVELYKITTAGKGKVILTKDKKPDIECVPEIPFFAVTPIPQPHKLTGLSLADLTMDLQLIKSTLVRQMLDNGYLSNWPRVEVGDDVANENTYEDLVNLSPGNLVRTRRVGGIVPLSVPYTADKTFPLVEYLDQQQEIRTGVARQNQGLNPDDLNRTAAGINMLQQAAAQRVELFARIFAIGLQQVLRQVLNLVRRHQQQQRIIRITGKFITIDPRQWVDEMPVTVSVGLGTGNRDQVLSYLMQILGVQQGIVQQQGGLQGPLVYGKNVYDVLEKLCENAGFREPFFADPSRPPDPALTGPPQPPRPDPAAQAIQAKAQAAIQAVQAKAQSDLMIAQVKAQIETGLAAKTAENDAQIEQIRAASRLQVEQAQAAHEMNVAELKAHNEMAIEKMKAEQKAEIAALEIRLKFQAGAYTPGPAPAQGIGNGRA